MENLISILYSTQFNKQAIIEAYNNDIDDMIINESFKSELLKNLAQKIYKVETKHREYDKNSAKHWKEQGYFGTPNKTASAFASIFGPITKTGKYGDSKSGIQGLKWSEITDDDFELITGNDIAKKIKQLYTKKIKFDCIACKPGTKIPMFFVKGYGETKDVKVYTFASPQKFSGVNKVTARAYKYQERDLKYDETADILDGLDVYVLEITDDMIKNYSDLHIDRLNSRKGMINYDKESLEELLKRQKAKYRRLVDEMKANKLQSNSQDFFNEIKKVNDEVVQLYQDIMSNPENLDKYFDLGRLMTYVSYAYESFYKSTQYKYKSERLREKAIKRGASPEEYDRYGSYEEEESKNYINNAKEYIDKIKKEMEEIRSKL